MTTVTIRAVDIARSIVGLVDTDPENAKAAALDVAALIENAVYAIDRAYMRGLTDRVREYERGASLRYSGGIAEGRLQGLCEALCHLADEDV